MTYLKTILLSGVMFSCAIADAQQDTSYFASYTQQITTRAFLSQKYTALRFKNKQENYSLDYLPNSKLTVGVGATYKWATLNIALAVAYLNPDEGKGKTRHLDLQFHRYGKKFALDLVGQFYRGFYLFPKGTATSPDRYYARPDLKVNLIGGSYQYIVNHRKFSLQATYLQNQWQKKSAGSLLIGIESYVGRIKGDSTITPTTIDNQLAELRETHINFFELGINAGYAYTVVIKKHFFITGSVSGSLGYSVNTLKNNNGNPSPISPNTFFRLMTGYNSAKRAISLIYINNGVRFENGIREVTLNTGNLRLSYAQRFKPTARERKFLKAIN